MAMANRKTTISGYIAIILAVAAVAKSFLDGEPIDLNMIMGALGLGAAGAVGINASDGGR